MCSYIALKAILSMDNYVFLNSYTNAFYHYVNFPTLQVKMSIQIRNSVKNNIPVQIIMRNLIASGFKVSSTEIG